MRSEPENPLRSTAPLGSEVELQAERASVRRRLRRANLASVLILMVVIVLAMSVVWKARESVIEANRARAEAQHASREAERAQQATARAETELWNSRLNETRAERYAERRGGLIPNRDLISELARHPNLTEDQRLALRQEAIAQLAWMDLQVPTRSATNLTAVPFIWSAQLDRYASADPTGTVEVIDARSGKRVAEFLGPAGSQPHAITLSPDGRLIAVRFHGSEVRVWDLTTSQLLLTTRCDRMPEDSAPIQFLPDSRSLGLFTTNGLTIQAIEQPSISRVIQKGRFADAASFSADSTRMAVVARDRSNTVEVWDLASGAVLKRFEPTFQPTGVEWHPDGRRLGIVGDRGQAALWDLGAARNDDLRYPRETTRFIGHLSTITFFAFTSDGSQFITSSWDGTSRFWDVVSGREVFRETRFTIGGSSVSGHRILGVSTDGQQEFVCERLPPKGFATVASTGGPRALQGVWLSPDARLLAVSYLPGPGESAGEVHLWDFRQQVELARLRGIWAQFGPDSQQLYTFASDGIRRYDVSAASLNLRNAGWSEATVLYRSEAGVSVNTGEISGDGHTLVVAAVDRVLLIDANTGTVTSSFDANAHYVTPTKDGRAIATSFQNDRTVLRDAKTGHPLFTSEHFARSVSSPDTRWWAVSERDSVKLLRYPSLEKVFDLSIDMGAYVPTSTDFAPDSQTLAVAYHRSDVRLYDVPSGRLLATFSAPNPTQIAAGHGIEFSRDGRWLLVARDSGDVVSWDLQVVRAELEKLRIDWREPYPAPRPALSSSSVRVTRNLKEPLIATVDNHAILEAAAFIVTLLTLVGGIYVFSVQRRLLMSHDRVESIALEQRHTLESARSELMRGEKMRALGTLAAGVAHDFNNLLSVIRLSNQLAAEQSQAKGAAKENMETIESAVSQGESIVRSMLGYSRAGSEMPMPYAVDDVVNEGISMLGRKFLSGIILKLELEKGLPRVHGSRSRLEQMFLNLVVNASEAMGNEGELSITVRLKGEVSPCVLKPRAAVRYIELAVGDTGPGIPPATLSRIFEPFFTTKTRGAKVGTGLGLSTVYTMAEQEGMGLSVTTGQQTGTTFRVVVPVAEDAAS